MNKSSHIVRYLPIGDSYTIGEGVNINENFPSLLKNKLSDHSLPTTILKNPAVTGYTTQNVIDKELPLLESLKPDFCTLLIGVNDWVQEVSPETYDANLKFILDKITQQVGSKLVLVTIPDFSVSAKGSEYAKGRNITEGIERFNNIAKELAQKNKINIADIFSLSKQQNTTSHFAADQLHPSSKAYSEWVDIILPKAIKVLSPSHQLGE